MRWGCVVLLAVTGCDLVFLDEHERPETLPLVTGSLAVRWVENDDEGHPRSLVDVPSASDVRIEVVFADGRLEPVAYAEDGTFRFARQQSEQPYRLRLDIEGHRFDIQHDASEIAYVERQLGRRDRVRVQQDTLISYDLPTDGIDLLFVATGLYSQLAVAPSAHVVNWRGGGSLSGPMGLLSAARGDRLYVFERENVPYLRIKRALEARFDMIDGVPVKIMQPLVATPPNLCAKLAGAWRRSVERLLAVGDHGSVVGQWVISAAPDPTIAPNVIPLAGLSMRFAADLSDLADLAVDVSAHHPLRPLPLLATSRIFSQRLYQHPQATEPATDAYSFVGLHVPIEDRPDCGAAVQLDPTIAIPGPLTVDGQLVGADFAAIRLGGTPVAIHWDLASAGPYDNATVVLFEMVVMPGSPSRTTFNLLASVQTAGSEVLFDRTLFKRSSYYMVRVDLRVGLAPGGDYTALTYPFEEAVVHGRVFQVVN